MDLPGPALAICSLISYSLVTGLPGKTSLMVETVLKTVEDTDEVKVDLNLFNTSIIFYFSTCSLSVDSSERYWIVFRVKPLSGIFWQVYETFLVTS